MKGSEKSSRHVVALAHLLNLGFFVALFTCPYRRKEASLEAQW